MVLQITNLIFFVTCLGKETLFFGLIGNMKRRKSAIKTEHEPVELSAGPSIENVQNDNDDALYMEEEVVRNVVIRLYAF